MELLKSAGYNAIRCAHNPPAPALLDACDRLGMLVIDETFDCLDLGQESQRLPPVLPRNGGSATPRRMVKRDRNHPSVILWSIGNEIFEALGDPSRGGVGAAPGRLYPLARQHALRHFRYHAELPGRYRQPRY